MKTSLAWLNTYLDKPITAEEADTALTAAGFPLDGIDPVEDSALGLSDTLLDVEVTSNRSDCLSHLGVAREVAATTGRKLQHPDLAIHEPHATNLTAEEIQSRVKLENHAPSLCQLYTARIIEDVKIGPSPAWLVKALASVGQDSINNVADITNYVLLELGQPMHAFDLDKLAGGKIDIRFARKGEKMAALNSETYEFDESHLVIADGEKPVALAGVMGGEDSKVTEETKNILLEVALFDPVCVRQAVRNLKVKVKNKLGTESSHRFERALDYNGVAKASLRAAKLICEVTGGKLLISDGQSAMSGVLVSTPARTVGSVTTVPERRPAEVKMRVSRCHQILGMDIPVETMVGYFEQLQMAPKVMDENGENVIQCLVPTFRSSDVSREIDLIEEIARMISLDAIPMNDNLNIQVKSIQPHIKARRRIRSLMCSYGLFETVNLSRMGEKEAGPFLFEMDRDQEELKLAVLDDEHHAHQGALRPSIIPSLLICRKTNQDVGNHNVRLFETGSTWCTGVAKGAQIGETERLGMIIDNTTDAATTYRELRGLVTELVNHLGGQHLSVVAEPIEHPAYEVAARLMLVEDSRILNKRLGVAGILNGEILKKYGLQAQVGAAELDLKQLIAIYPSEPDLSPLAKFPAIERDLSILVKENISWRQIQDAVNKTEPALMESLAFMGTYRGKQIAKGEKSVSFRMCFRDPESTLKHEQVDPQVAQVVESLKADVEAILRD